MAAPPPPPPAPGLRGRLYRYRTSPNSLQAFESPADHASRWFAIYIGGLTDGLLACPYVDGLLADECERRGWALVQPILSSSYLGYGTGSLGRDAGELGELVDFLAAERQAKAVVLIGHSTGCQDSVHFLRTAAGARRMLVRGAVLQAPVSDREAATVSHGSAENAEVLARAEELIAAGRGGEIVTMHYGFCPITADRFASLVGRGGPDDLFSSDFTDAELASLLGHMCTTGQRALPGTPEHPGLRTLAAFSMADEYVPPTVDTDRLVDRLVAAMGGGGDVAGLKLQGANHNLSLPAGAEPSSAARFVAAVGDLLDSVAANE